ncbi:hypothetical protein NIES2101_40500 [Calothrix sp. HK-06]|nr:hypothetical protein NIES2101_40500 [Calothrix sp. HK-06]
MKNLINLLLTLFLIACTSLKPLKSTNTSPSIHVQTDQVTLEKQINLPQNINNVRWIVLQQGVSSSVPGPTDTILYAVLTPKNNDWSSLAKLKSSSASQESVEVPVQIAKKLFSPKILKQLHQANDYVQITGEQYEPNFFNKYSYRGVYAILVHNNLLVCLQTT